MNPLTDSIRSRIRTFVLAAEVDQDLMRACVLLRPGAPGLRQERFVVERLTELEARRMVYFDRGGYWLSPTGREARDVFLATARALMRRAR